MKTILILQNLGAPEIIILAVVILLLFGGKKIPELMRGLGKGVKSFKKGMTEVESEMDEAVGTAPDASKKPSDNGNAGKKD